MREGEACTPRFYPELEDRLVELEGLLAQHIACNSVLEQELSTSRVFQSTLCTALLEFDTEHASGAQHANRQARRVSQLEVEDQRHRTQNEELQA